VTATHDEVQTQYIRPLAEVAERKSLKVIAALRARGFDGVFFPTAAEAVGHIVKLIPENSLVAFGGSMSVLQSGLLDELRSRPLRLLDRFRPGLSAEEQARMRAEAMHADYLIASSNAVTADGKLVNEDGVGNRVGGMILGPSKVVLLVGVNKIVLDVEEAIRRIKNVAAPANCLRLGHRTPCAETGFCDDARCVVPERICCQLTILEANRAPGRITVVLSGEPLGF
jgi:hypothetical protein